MKLQNEQLILQQLIKISQYAGMREDIVQAGGGNTSVKTEDGKLIVKASGYQLTDINLSDGYSVVDRKAICDFLTENCNDLVSDTVVNTLFQTALIVGKRPSIEVFLHATTDVLTLHTHPIAVNILAMRQNGLAVLKELFSEGLIVGYETPGIKLAKEYFKAEKEYGKTGHKIIFLKNHGLIVTGKTADEVIACHEEVLSKIENYLGLDMTSYHNSTLLWNAFVEVGQNGIIWRVTDENVLRTYRELAGLWQHEFCPDCLVYCGKRMLKIDTQGNLVSIISKHIKEYGDVSVIEFAGNLYIHAHNVAKALEIQSVLSFSAQVMRVNQQQNCDFLNEAEQNFILHWESETYRQALKK